MNGSPFYDRKNVTFPLCLRLYLQMIIKRERNAQMKKRFEEIYLKYRDTVYSYLYYMCREEELALDLAQETFLKIFLGMRKFRGECSEKTWCLTIARNTFLTYARKKQPMLLGDPVFENLEDIPENLPEERMIRRESARIVREVLLMLSEDERTMLLLRDYEGLSYGDIAQMLSLTEANVKVKLHRIRRKYRALYLHRAKEMEG